MSKKTAKDLEVCAAPQDRANAVLSIVDKTKLAANLVTAMENDGVKDTILNLPSGDVLYALLDQSVQAYLQKLFGDGLDHNKEINSASETINRLHASVDQMSRSPLMTVLYSIASKLSTRENVEVQPPDTTRAVSNVPHQNTPQAYAAKRRSEFGEF